MPLARLRFVPVFAMCGWLIGGSPLDAEPPDAEATPLPTVIAPTNPAIRYIGRFDFSKDSGPRCSWSASTVALRFDGSALNVKLQDGGQDRWQIEIDGQPASALQLQPGEHLYRVADGLPDGEHVVRLVKATEPMIGITKIGGFQLSEGGRLLASPAPKRRIEVIGDSISCGYGNEAPNQNVHFSPKTENAYFTYGALAARVLGADYTCIAWSGRKMWPDNTTPEIYDLINPTEAGSHWDFAKAPPANVVLINLSTNDFGKGNPDEAGWTNAYEQFIARLRTHYPKAMIYCATSPMMGDWGGNKALTTVKGYLHKIIGDLNAAGDADVRFLEFAVQDQKNGLGADWHPSVKTQSVMGEKFIETLRADLHW